MNVLTATYLVCICVISILCLLARSRKVLITLSATLLCLQAIGFLLVKITARGVSSRAGMSMDYSHGAIDLYNQISWIVLAGVAVCAVLFFRLVLHKGT